MMWWIKNPGRLKAEVADLEALRDRVAWLRSVTPAITKGLKFTVDLEVEVQNESFRLVLEYPAFYPDTPPSVTPVDDVRLSNHQYGAGGELCLEYRSDNWDSAINGAMMVESAHRLLAGERPPTGGRAEVPSAHHATLGQRLRGTAGRFLLTRGLQEAVAALPVGERRSCFFSEIFGPARTWTAYCHSIGPSDPPVWQETSIPFRSDTRLPGLLVRVGTIDGVMPETRAELDQIAAGQAPPDATAATSEAVRFFVLADEVSARLYFTLNDGTLFPYVTVDLTAEADRRLPPSYAALAGKKVGVVGCGSLGSKIAVSLARSGVGRFVLVDDDILKPGNLVRHELDAAGLGIHKADGVEARLRAVSAAVEVSARKVILGGQESAGTTASVLDELATCDLLIDATADPHAFNFVASVALSSRRPMIWSEVYAGGIGGFVGRLRPDIEPPPYQARQRYLAWCRERDVPWHAEDRDYQSESAGATAVADDADVTSIAAHAARMAADCLLRPDASAFPHAVYVIGLTKAWLFEEPLDVRPIEMAGDGPWQTDGGPENSSDATSLVLALLEKASDENRAASGD